MGLSILRLFVLTQQRLQIFSAERNGEYFLIEVVTSIYFAPRTFHDSVVKWATSRLQNDDKLSQMKTDSAVYKNLFVCVVNSSGAVALNQRSDCLIILKEIWHLIGSDLKPIYCYCYREDFFQRRPGLIVLYPCFDSV